MIRFYNRVFGIPIPVLAIHMYLTDERGYWERLPFFVISMFMILYVAFINAQKSINDSN